jgi:hypothetical protein
MVQTESAYPQVGKRGGRLSAGLLRRVQEFAEGSGFGRGMAAIHRKKFMVVLVMAVVVGTLGFNPSPLNDL